MDSELAKIAKEIGTFEQLKTMDKFLTVVNQQPLADWVTDHPIAKNVKYLCRGVRPGFCQHENYMNM